jgi:hypothetical protein
VDDPYDILDCALRSRYLAPEDSPKATVWHNLPAELRSALADALASGADLRRVVPLIWQVRTRLHGPPSRQEADGRTQATVRLRLGLLYLCYREGRIGAEELLSRAFQVADSYVCDVDARPFARLCRELRGGTSVESVAPRVAALFSLYLAPAVGCVESWGLRLQGAIRDIGDTRGE